MNSPNLDRPSVSWVILTHNRAEIVEWAFDHNFDNAGYPFHEIVWCDNGSKPAERYYMENVVFGAYVNTTILNRLNLGAAKGYNRAMGLATGDYIVITGCDMLMPEGWLKTFMDYVTKIPETGMALMYSRPLDKCPERLLGPRQTINGLDIIPAFPVERRIFKRELLADFGYFPETFGLYGFDDLALAHRIIQVCNEKNLYCYLIPDQVPIHLDGEGVDTPTDDYTRFKHKEALDPAKRAEFERLRQLNFPRFTPFL